MAPILTLHGEEWHHAETPYPLIWRGKGLYIERDATPDGEMEWGYISGCRCRDGDALLEVGPSGPIPPDDIV